MLSSIHHPHEAVHGFVRGKSTVTGAQPHIDSALVLSVDLKNFYAQIDFPRAVEFLREHFDDDSLAWIEGACFRDGSLPLGFRTSPVLSNVAFAATDVLISDLARENNVNYTRWVDDLSFSGPDVNDLFLADLTNLLSSEKWILNHAKTRFMRRSPYVLGLYVGLGTDSPRLPRWMKKRLLLETYYLARYGRSHFEHRDVLPLRRLRGHVAYVISIDPALGARLNRRIQEGLARN